jgi:glycosyltransferase involved in cell wall biosynthesis
MNKSPLSVFIIAQNEGDRIGTTINSVKAFADEIIVIDSGSKDDTVSVAEALGARVIFNPWEGYGQQKSFGESQCRNDWILNLDADEEVSEALAIEINSLFLNSAPSCAAYTLPMLPLYPFQQQGYRWMVHNSPVRLYDKRRAQYHDDTIHDYVKVHEGAIGKLKGLVIHRSFRSLSHHVEKMNAYSNDQAISRFKKKRKPTFIELLTLPLFAFIKCYLFRRGFMMGTDGIILSHMYAFQRFVRIAKTRELFELEKKAQQSKQPRE